MANYLKTVVEATKKLLQAVPEAVANPTDKVKFLEISLKFHRLCKRK
jgi:hypothetical protein